MGTIKHNAIINSVMTVANVIFPLVTFPYVSRILGVEEMGNISFFSSVASYATIVSSLGISTYGIRACAQVREDKEKLSKTVEELVTINFIMTVITLVFVGFSAVIIPKFSQGRTLLIINCVGVALNVVGINWMYSALEQYDYIAIRSLLAKLFSMICVFSIIKTSEDCWKYAAITVLAASGSNILNLIHSRKFICWKMYDGYHLRKHISSMLIMFSSTLAINIYTNLDTVMLGFVGNEHEVGLYTIAVKIKFVLLNIINSLSVVLLPRLSFYIAQNYLEKFNEALKRSIRIVLEMAIPFTVFFMIFAQESILILAGDDYLEAVPCMQITMPILIISGISNITGNQILIPNQQEKFFLRAVMLGAMVDLIFNILFIRYLGCVGVAIATLIAELTQTLYQIICSKRYLKDNVDIVEIGKAVFAVAVAALMAILVKGTAIEGRAIIQICMCGISFFTTYIVLMFCMRTEITYYTKYFVTIMARRKNK